MARYVMANRRAGKFDKEEKSLSLDSVSVTFERSFLEYVDVIHDEKPSDEQARRIIVFDAEPSEVASKISQMGPDVIVEPEILHFKATALPLDVAHLRSGAKPRAIPAGTGRILTVTITSDGALLEGARVVLFLRAVGPVSTRQEEISPGNGQVTFDFSPFWQPAALVVYPAGDFWSSLVRNPSDGLQVDLSPLPKEGPLEWWHELMGVDQYSKALGSGIRVGVIDTGVGPHPNLNHVKDVGAFIDAVHHSGLNDGKDVHSHGSHVCGIIGAQPQQSDEYAGIAVGGDIFSARVFRPGKDASQADISEAIDYLSSQEKVDLINLSLGSYEPSEVLNDAIVDALERGTLCICAAANDGMEQVAFPARFPETVAVSAIGQAGWGPNGTLASLNYPEDPNKYGYNNLYLANFSNFGTEVVCCGPGVGIISTVPQGYGLAAPYAAMSGTSMASPAVCAILAGILSSSTDYTNLSRDYTRSEKARALLRMNCADIGVDDKYQGRGITRIT